ncbi:alpha/beta hydrolase [Parvularcula oceani]|uniref:alpha/beta hydrolase n=1 Tax=Parvularcula oceani TaxID=1247963 RepID=UPI00192E3B74|nr:alpha/beta hydrolase-fold protein [Parvularcula oceani]
MMRLGPFLIVSLLLLAVGPAPAAAEGGRVETITVHGESLEGNLEGNDPDREVIVYLPPGYDDQPDRRYPVVVNLHGYTSTAGANVEYLEVPESIDRAIERGVGEVIVVFPDAMTRHGGSMYSSSETVGDWEAFIAEDLVAAVDERYRTIGTREARGLSGHSMGGYGTMRIGMKYPDVFSSLYAMSACCLEARSPAASDADAEAVGSVEEARDLDFFARALFASAAAWAPNPDKPPFFLDLPTEGGEPQREVYAAFAAGAVNALVHQYVPELRTYEAIGLEIGDKDFLLEGNEALTALLTSYDVEHTYETYDGDHVNRLPERFEKHLLPFFGRHLLVTEGASRR